MDVLFETLARVSDPLTLGMLLAGVLVGLVVGALPGIGGVFAMVLLLPLTDDLGIYAIMGLLIGLTSVTTTSDTMPAVLIGVPGSAAAIATVEDGHPLARQGQGDRALGAAYSASMIGGLFGAVVLALAIPVLRPFVLALRSPDFLAVSVCGLLFVAVVAGKEPIKGVLAALFGILASLVGLDPLQGSERFTFGSSYLWDGLTFSIVFIGLFGLVELGDLLRRGRVVDQKFSSSLPRVLDGVKDTLREWRLVFASSTVGTLIGAIPGIGVTTIDWIAYGIATRDRKGGPPYGEGNIRGVIAPESANNAKEGGNLIPTLAVGLPGSVGMIFVLSVLSSNGVAPGPSMLTEHLPLVYSIVIFVALANVLGTGFCLVLTKQIASLASAPVAYLVPIALSLIVMGALREHLIVWDVVLLAAFGLIGLLMKANGWSRAAFALGFMLAPNIERYYFLSAQLNGWTFLTRPAVLVVVALFAIGLIWLVLGRRVRWRDLVVISNSTGDRVILIGLAIVAVVALFQASQYHGGSETFPLLIAGSLLAVTVPSLVSVFAIKGAARTAESWGGPATLLALIAALTVLVYAIGHLPGVAFFAFGAIVVLDRKRWRGAMVAAAATTAITWLIFDELQHVSWPTPLIDATGLFGI
ncbi:MAG: tripartite tricarboxylate transporter permease [Devosia sp.]